MTETEEQARLLGMSGERELALRAEIERLRAALIASGNNAGAVLGDLATTDFLMGVPDEIKLVVARLKRERDEARALCDELSAALARIGAPS